MEVPRASALGRYRAIRSFIKRAKSRKRAKRFPRPELNLLAFFISLVFLWAELVPFWLCSVYFCLNINLMKVHKAQNSCSLSPFLVRTEDAFSGALPFS